MRCPSLSELPPAPSGKTGWPWTEESQQLPCTMPDGRSWPKISIITPSYNQGRFIEETIRSVILQGYPNLEYIIIDGDSSDHSLEIIKKYEPWLTYWVSESDRGQAHAINKGFDMATGEVVAWLNSDDVYCEDATAKVMMEFCRNLSVDIVYGNCDWISENGNLVQCQTQGPGDFAFMELIKWNAVSQPAVFLRKNFLDTVGLLDEWLRFAMDYELWIRCSKRSDAKHLPSTLARFRVHRDSKTFDIFSYSPESLMIILKYGGEKAFVTAFGLRCLKLAKMKERSLEEVYAHLKGQIVKMSRRGYIVVPVSFVEKACFEGYLHGYLLEGHQLALKDTKMALRNLSHVFLKCPALLLRRVAAAAALRSILGRRLWHSFESIVKRFL